MNDSNHFFAVSYDKPCQLLFLYSQVTSVADYDPTDDQILGPFEYLQQVMVRGLMADWQLPVFFDFNRAVDRTLLEELVTQLEEAGARVMAVVSDQGGSNRGLWTQLQIRPDGPERCTHFQNPVDASR